MIGCVDIALQIHIVAVHVCRAPRCEIVESGAGERCGLWLAVRFGATSTHSGRIPVKPWETLTVTLAVATLSVPSYRAQMGDKQ